MMATLPEIAEWVAGIYQIEESDPVLGGPPNETTGAGIINIPKQQLAKRTAFLKQVLDEAGIGAAAAPSVADFSAVNKSGMYQGNNASGAPEPGLVFTLLHIQSSATQATQIASRITGDRVWVRRLSGGVWSSWREILHTGNAAQALGLGSAATANVGVDAGQVLVGPFATQAQAEAGIDTARPLSALGLRQALRAAGNAPVFACRAWVNFNGTGTVSIRGSGNVSSITDNGVGAYAVNFATPMPDVNYAMVGSTDAGPDLGNKGPYIGTLSTTSAPVFVYRDTGAAFDTSVIHLAFFR